MDQDPAAGHAQLETGNEPGKSSKAMAKESAWALYDQAMSTPEGRQRITEAREILKQSKRMAKELTGKEPPKHSLKKLNALLASHDQARRAGRPLRESSAVRGWRVRRQELLLKAIDRGDVTRRREIRKAEAKFAERVVAAREAGVTMRACAERLGMTREGVYKLLNRVGR